MCFNTPETQVPDIVWFGYKLADGALNRIIRSKIRAWSQVGLDRKNLVNYLV